MSRRFKLKESYGTPPFLVPALCLKVFLAVLAVAVVGFVVIALLHEPLELRDAIGTLVCTPIVAYLIHLWLAPVQ